MAFDKVLLVTIAEAEKGSWTAKHWAFWSVYMSVLTQMQNDQGRHSQHEPIECVLPRSPANTTKWGSQYEAMECFLNECRWLHTETVSYSLFFLLSIPWLVCDLGSKRPQNYKSRERSDRKETLCFSNYSFLKWDIYRILQWLPSSQQTFL